MTTTDLTQALLDRGWTHDGRGWISPVHHPRSRKGKHDARAWGYADPDTNEERFAMACTGCGLNLVGLESLADAEYHRDYHWREEYERPPEVLYTTKGHEVEVQMTDAEAAEVLAGMTWSDFAQDLAQLGPDKWSERQRPWAHKLANDQATKPAKPAKSKKPTGPAYTFPRTAAMLGRAGESLTYPTIRVTDWLHLTLMTGGRNEGTITITDGGKYPDNEFYGRMELDGSWNPTRNTPDRVTEALKAFEADPEGEALAYGRETGACCFCRRELTNEGSVSVGYGPICAGHYGLPHPSN